MLHAVRNVVVVPVFMSLIACEAPSSTPPPSVTATFTPQGDRPSDEPREPIPTGNTGSTALSGVTGPTAVPLGTWTTLYDAMAPAEYTTKAAGSFGLVADGEKVCFFYMDSISTLLCDLVAAFPRCYSEAGGIKELPPMLSDDQMAICKGADFNAIALAPDGTLYGLQLARKPDWSFDTKLLRLDGDSWTELQVWPTPTMAALNAMSIGVDADGSLVGLISYERNGTEANVVYRFDAAQPAVGATGGTGPRMMMSEQNSVYFATWNKPFSLVDSTFVPTPPHPEAATFEPRMISAGVDGQVWLAKTTLWQLAGGLWSVIALPQTTHELARIVPKKDGTLAAAFGAPRDDFGIEVWDPTTLVDTYIYDDGLWMQIAHEENPETTYAPKIIEGPAGKLYRASLRGATQWNRKARLERLEF